MSRSSALAILLAGLAQVLCAQNPPAAPGPSAAAPHIDLVIERLENGQWKALGPKTVLDEGNSIRFRVQASFPGYLYAFSRASDGEAEWLYPIQNSAASNQIAKGVSYLIPSATQSYIVTGRPGFDIVYWLISPKPMPGDGWLPPRDTEPVTRTMVPRCRDDLDAAAACFDPRAGVAPLAQAGPSSQPFAPGGLKPRELRLSPNPDTTRIEAVDGPGLFVYEFRIAHR